MATDSELPSSLVLVAPLPRRPIALVARRQPSHQSRPRAGRTSLPQSSATQQTSGSVPSTIQSAGGIETSSSRCHPYSRAKTPVGGGLGPAMSPTMLPVVGDFTSSSAPRRRSLARVIDTSDCVTQLPAAITALSMSATARDEAMDSEATTSQKRLSSETPTASVVPTVTSPIQRSNNGLATTDHVLLDVDRTPTKKALREMANQLNPEDSADTPSLHPGSPVNSLPQELVALSPTLPPKHRLGSAFSSPSAQMHSTFPLMSSTFSAAPSPSLSESQSRSPSSSPSPCPSPSLADSWRPHSPHFASDWSCSEQYDDSDTWSYAYSSSSSKDMIPLLLSQRRKLGLPLPAPTSPVPRKMTRNPFERNLNLPPSFPQWRSDTTHDCADGQVGAGDRAHTQVDMQDE